ncbi:hypothetical protein M436DRAFT_86481 [Aureobasidium namibiae CBS 147.97]|uniref:Uncharacterized protein n=1 Tax=Aureobasidium namibiae CBS 147.97 TaxID=1043004 RepID=A0A074W5E5_9PEZI
MFNSPLIITKRLLFSSIRNLSRVKLLFHSHPNGRFTTPQSAHSVNQFSIAPGKDPVQAASMANFRSFGEMLVTSHPHHVWLDGKRMFYDVMKGIYFVDPEQRKIEIKEEKAATYQFIVSMTG